MLTNQTDIQFDIDNPVEIDKVCNDLRLLLKDKLSWVSHPFHIAQRFFQKKPNDVGYIYPQTYIKNPEDSVPKYITLTPNNGYKGMFFFMVGAGKNDFDTATNNNITWPVSIIFSCNLELIDPTKLKEDGIFTQDLIRSARRVLSEAIYNFDYMYKVVSETRDLREVYREFSLNDLEQYNRLPLQCFRIDLLVTLQEDC
jgi:hypothetical protein